MYIADTLIEPDIINFIFKENFHQVFYKKPNIFTASTQAVKTIIQYLVGVLHIDFKCIEMWDWKGCGILKGLPRQKTSNKILSAEYQTLQNKIMLINMKS